MKDSRSRDRRCGFEKTLPNQNDFVQRIFAVSFYSETEVYIRHEKVAKMFYDEGQRRPGGV
jgi:hypothetical protein